MTNIGLMKHDCNQDYRRTLKSKVAGELADGSIRSINEGTQKRQRR